MARPNRSTMPTSQKTDQAIDPVVPIPKNPDNTAVDWNPVRQATDRVIAGFADRQSELTPEKLDPPAPKRNPKPAPASSPEYFTELQLQDCWREHHSRIVRLNIANSLGEKRAIGTLVDSRGWILTSYRAILGATQIRVTQSASSFEQFQNQEAFHDVVRGVLAVDREHDLAVLAINRRFVVNFSDLKRADNDVLAATDHVVQFGLIDDDTPLFVRETQVIGRPAFADLDADAEKYFADVGLNTDSLKWITLSNLQGVVGGAPLLTVEGELVGMCTEQPAAGIGYAVPVAALDPLLKLIETDANTGGGNSPLDLAAWTGSIEQVESPNSNPGTSVDVDSEYRDVSVQLNQIGTQCSQFGWVPTNLEQYRVLQEFSRQLIAINNTIYEIPDDPDLPEATTNLANRATLQEQSEHWTAELKSSLAPQPLPPNQVGDFNRVSAQSLESVDVDLTQLLYYISYVRVRLGAMDSPKRTGGVDTITLDIDQTDEIVMVSFDDRFPPMRPDTLWLAIYAVDDTGQIKFIDSNTDEEHEAHAGQILMVLGPLE